MDLLELIDFLEPPVSIGFDVTPDQALEYFHAKGLKRSFSYADLSADEHANSFTIAKMADTDLLADVKNSLEDAMLKGVPFKQWANEIMPTLQAKGWIAPDGPGAPHRLETIFRTNMQSAYAVGEWQQIRAQEEIAPYLMYDAVDDFRTRPEHAAMDGKIHPVSSVFWKHYHPPNGYNCRCSVIQLSGEELEELGLELSPEEPIPTYDWKNPKTGKVEKVAVGTDPGFDHNPGEKRYQELNKVAIEKAKALKSDAEKAAMEGLIKSQQAAAQTARVEAQAILQASKLSNASKAAERAAAAAINAALDNKTPYLSAALKILKGTKGAENLSATELLAQAKEKAFKLEQSTQLSEYKKAVTASKKPSAKAQAAFDALPDEAQHALTDQINSTKAAVKAENDALDEISALTANPNSLAAKTLAKMETAGVPAVKVLADLKASVASQKAKQIAAQNLGGLKKAMLAGKVPTPAQKAAFDALTPDEQAQLIADVAKVKAKELADAEAAKPKAEQPPPPKPVDAIPTQTNVADTGLDPDDLVQTGPQGGSNPGGEYTDTSTGVKWYVKYPDNIEALRNEALAANLYRLAGVDMPEVRLITFKGKPAIASRIVEGLKAGKAELTRGRVPGMQENFAIDAWLSNWDVVGPDYANTKLNALGRAVRIDPGGALRFRAQGGMKGAAFGNDVLDLESMRDGSTNPHAASVFKHVTKADIEDGVRRILAITDKDIVKLLGEYGPLDITERQKLFRTLVARREYLRKKYPGAAPQAPEKLPDLRVTEAEQRSIEAARANGVTLPTDSDVIEDHQVVVTVLKDAGGKPRTRLTMKLRPQAGQQLQKTMPAGVGAVPPVAELSSLKSKALQFLKGVGALANKGEVIRDTDLTRANEFLKEALAMTEKLYGAGNIADRAMADRARVEIGRLYALVSAWTKRVKVGEKAVAFEKVDLNAIPDRIEARPPTQEGSALPWKQTGDFIYNVAKIDRGHMTETGRTSVLPGVDDVREVELDGTRVRYIPYGKGNSVSAEGYMQIDVDGAGVDVTAKAFDALKQLQIPTKRPSEIDRLELYLERIAAIRTLRNPQLTKDLAAIREIKDQASRTEEMLLALNKDVGFDMRTSPNWNPQGTSQAFGHGRTIMYRPDIKKADLDKFEKETVIYHNPTGLSVGSSDTWDAVKKLMESGGQLASQMDRVRRGVQSSGSSVGEDHRTGGANYVFTRLLSRSRLDQRTPGLYWKGRTAARLDAFSYDRDKFGAVSRTTQETSRARDLKEMRKHVSSISNETNFRDSLSLFDDLERIVLDNRMEYESAMKWMKDHGYTTWPDGRPIDQVLDYPGKPK